MMRSTLQTEFQGSYSPHLTSPDSPSGLQALLCVDHIESCSCTFTIFVTACDVMYSVGRCILQLLDSLQALAIGAGNKCCDAKPYAMYCIYILPLTEPPFAFLSHQHLTKFSPQHL